MELIGNVSEFEMPINRITAMVVDDCAEDISALCTLLAAIEPRIHVVATETDSIRALQLLKRQPVQLLFLDAHMPGLNGVTLVKSLMKRPRIIMITAYPDFAMDSYTLNLEDCISKPIEMDRLAVALHRAVGDLLGVAGERRAAHDHFFVKEKETSNIVKIFFVDLAVIEADHNDSIFHHADTTTAVRMPLKEVMEKLLPDNFLQVHRSFAVNTDNLHKYDRKNNDLYVHGYIGPIAVAKTHLAALMAAFDPANKRSDWRQEGGTPDDND